MNTKKNSTSTKEINLIEFIKKIDKNKIKNYIKIFSKFSKSDNKINFKKIKNEEEIKEMNTEQQQIGKTKMNKILYFCYGYFYKKFKKELFDAKFEAWQYGPVEIDYNRIDNENEKKIIKKFIVPLNQKQINFLKEIIEKLTGFSTIRLVELSHKSSPWIINYVGNNGKDWKPISIETIHDLF